MDRSDIRFGQKAVLVILPFLVILSTFGSRPSQYTVPKNTARVETIYHGLYHEPGGGRGYAASTEEYPKENSVLPSEQSVQIDKPVETSQIIKNAVSAEKLPNIPPSSERGEPSHIRLCRALLQRVEVPPGGKNSPLPSSVAVEEHNFNCRDWDSPMRMLMGIFSAALVAEAGKDFGLSYEHDCPSRMNFRTDKMTVQQALPSDFEFPASSFDEDVRNSIVSQCRQCIQMPFENSHNCVLLDNFSVTGEDVDTGGRMQETAVSLFESFRPSFQNTMGQVTKNYKEKNPNTREPDDVLIYLSCAEEDCSSGGGSNTFSVGMPFYMYAQEISRSVKDIAILISPSCAEFTPNCLSHGEALQIFLKTLHPTCSVTLAIESSTAAVYTRMILAEHLICPPGVACLLPSLLKDDYVTIVESPSLYPFLSSLPVATWRNMHIFPHSSSLIQPLLNADDMIPFLTQHPPNDPNCRKIRGRLGYWVQDREYTMLAQYVLPLQAYAGKADLNFIPSPDRQFRLPTTWKWVDTTFPSCPMDLLSPITLCETLIRLNLQRVFFVGDSLAYQQVQSLWKLFDYANDPPDAYIGMWSTEVQCPSGIPITLAFTRNDRLNDIKTSTEYGKKNCDDYCWPWTELYTREPSQPTLLIATAGPHYQDYDVFQRDFDTFVRLVDGMNRPDDVVFFRTAVPGHVQCQVKDIKPYENFHEYSKHISIKHSWDKFPMFNEYVDQTFQKRDRTDMKEKRTRMELLDVFPMTVLRPDGHLGGSDCIRCGKRECPDCKVDDCLHYSLPGPVDWWNHLLFNQLRDLANLSERGIR